MTKIDRFLTRDAVQVAEELLGWTLLKKEHDGSLTGGMIIETEAYNQDDAASHSYKGKTSRTAVMFGPAGHLYVYFTYGMHWCMNIVTGPKGRGEAVLIRAIKPERGLESISKRRNGRPLGELTNGPAKVCQALNIDGEYSGEMLNTGAIMLQQPQQTKFNVIATPRIGITKDTHRLWRFVLEEY